MFRELGIKLDELVYELKQWHYSNWYYKFYIYIRMKDYIKNDKFKNAEQFPRMMEQLSHTKQLYKWQYDKLKKLGEESNESNKQ